MKGFTVSPVWVAIVWVASLAIVWAVLTMQPKQSDGFAGVDRYLNQLRLFPLR
jgi:hypothetical protein